MGSGSSHAATPNKAIEVQLEKDKREQISTVKMILLGSGGSGKSTVVRQMKVLKGTGFTDGEKTFFRDHIYRNLVDYVLQLTSQIHENLNIDSKRAIASLDPWLKTHNAPSVDFVAMGRKVATILSDPQVTNALGKMGAHTGLADSAEYFFKNHERISSSGYLPSTEDILRCRISTTGVHELDFKLDKHTFRIIDVGGQRGQRKKWLHHFENVDGMLFVSAMSDYDKNMEEDETTNRMVDSLQLFKDLIRNPTFVKTAVLLFFNKKDIFMDKITHTPLTIAFPDYQHESTSVSDHENRALSPGFVHAEYKAATDFLREKFLSMRPPKKEVYTHFTNATDTSNIEQVINLTLNIVLKQNMMGMGLV